MIQVLAAPEREIVCNWVKKRGAHLHLTAKSCYLRSFRDRERTGEVNAHSNRVSALLSGVGQIGHTPLSSM